MSPGGLLSLARTTSFQNPLLSQRNVINVWYTDAEWNYSFIDHVVLGDNSLTPVGTAFGNAWSGTTTFNQVVDQNGWVNNTSGSGQLWGGGLRFPASTNFAGPYVITWDGDGEVRFNAATWTEASTTIVRTGNANGTTTLSGFTDVTGLSIGFPVTGTGVPGSTSIVSINYGTKTVVVNNAVTTGSGVSFTFTNNTYSRVANARWTNTTGGKGYVVASNSGHAGPNNLISVQIATTGTGGGISVSSMVWSGGTVTVTTAVPHGRPVGYTLPLTFFGATPSSINKTVDCTITGASTLTFSLAANPGSITGTITYIAFVTNVRVYRLEDETDFMPTSVGGNGYTYRTPYKQMMVNLRPAAIRLLNWINGNDSCLYRFENRSLPSKPGAIKNATAGPAYQPTSGTNQMTVPAVTTGTPGNSNLTPASMVHGEVVTTRVTNATSSGTIATITAISKGNPGQVTTATPHGLSNGDQVWFAMTYSSNAPSSMKELDRVAAKVANAASTTFDLTDLNGVNIDTTSFSTFTTGNFYRYVSLDAGGRGAYPVVYSEAGNGGASSNIGVNGLSANTYYTFYFDKNQANIRTAGTALTGWQTGVWLARSNFAWGDVPIEQCAALVAEVNILSQAQGISTPIHLWITMPPTGMLDCDPDYSAASEYPVNMIDAAFRGGYGCRGLNNSPASLILEWSNEIWNFGTFTANYNNWLAFVRGCPNTANFESVQALRSTRMARAVTSNSPWISRVKLVLGMQGFRGWDSQNQYVALANFAAPPSIIPTDPWNNWGSATPLSFHDAINPATYIQPSPGYSNTATGTGTLTDDSAMYNGTNNSSNGGGNYSGAANPAQAISNFVADLVGNSTNSNAQSFGRFCSSSNPSAGLLAQFATAMSSYSKRVIQYEGGNDWACGTGQTQGTHVNTAADSLFVNAVVRSSQLAAAQSQFFNNTATLASHGPPALYLYLKGSASDLRWGYAAPDSYSSGVEGAAINDSQMWVAMGARNSGLYP